MTQPIGSKRSIPVHPGVRPPWILPIIVTAQFAGTSLWFSGNAVLKDLPLQVTVLSHAMGYLASAVQLGFISGTLLFAIFAVADRRSPRIVFFFSSLLAAAANAMLLLKGDNLGAVLGFRFITGICLAGIYPVGMKIAAGWYKEGLGNALGFLIGALVLGTASPYLIKGWGGALPWELVISVTSLLSLGGGLLMLVLVPDGPFVTAGSRFRSATLLTIFRSNGVRSAAGGYFGHMWELYAFWAFTPLMLSAHAARNAVADFDSSFWTFWIIAAGSIGCVVGGMVSDKIGSLKVALGQLTASGACCLFWPLIYLLPTPLFLGVMLFWGIVVVGDSPQFSALVARFAPGELLGSALTLVNCIGFSITIVSIQLTAFLSEYLPPMVLFLLLLPGPLWGVTALRQMKRDAE